ncbi:MAG: hypothetical protein UX38_C0003G0047 [Microgenomates group bacterium GW2011_GWC1_46_16]|uniref:Uncharacterized protein n=2 Tax=Candidatus Collieribacteriota TaxID=1752725 RepID=A0A1F5G0K5_9BACT|nr:MAG: hypothetical protein UX32_C0002G0052 [Microgenomates group bacterium GW2011_GWF1_46_12]KKU26782.1 MAG: hypothetical protein UX38_C0003G0047 [Microgenomates group bacterium GW2011_GWC1_46_16]KKU28016.1 MAG: hypothetical protein UX40_C0004G0046 [Microgenomates group bacterium GW2011_GWF2_46_18]KKU44251.1 MAG: hypothetical protein UX59_C0002G0037 [Microgenomates group bacterium GW2011_GWA1_46_7]KKU61729.1 MAG: hypothetical protein UX82_C0002G0007 [Microgenomates group bacterium GW2011_GWE1
MSFQGLGREFSKNLSFFESGLGGVFPAIERGKALEIARQEIAEGRPAYLKAKKDSQALMVYVEPRRDGLVWASVVPALHFVTSHGLGRHQGTTDRVESFAEILRQGFRSPTGENNALLLTPGYGEEKWKSGYPREKINGYFGGWYMTKQNAQDRGANKGDSLRVVLWSGFYAENRVKVQKGGIQKNSTCVDGTSIGYVEGVVVTAPGSDWRQRIEYYRNLYREQRLHAPLEIFDVQGQRVRVE